MTKGNYYKYKSKKWLEEKGYKVEYLEKLQRIYDKKNNKVIFVKVDLFASDILAISKDEIIFVQVKLNKKNIAEAIKEFNKYPFPNFATRWVLVWTPRVGEPEIVNVE